MERLRVEISEAELRKLVREYGRDVVIQYIVSQIETLIYFLEVAESGPHLRIVRDRDAAT